MRTRSRFGRLAPLAACALLGACAVMPTGPSTMSLPGTGKSFDEFRRDDALCRGYASQQVGGQTANDAAVQSGVASAAIGTAIGAAAGAAIGGSSQGAAVGAGTGLVVGSAIGASNAYASSWELQRRYDDAYRQCMYAKGHRVAVHASFTPSRGWTPQPPAPPPGTPPPPPSVSRLPPPPPPPGKPPPPPPR